MKFIVGSVALASGGKIFAPGAEISESDFSSAEDFEKAKNKGFVVASDDGGKSEASNSGSEEPSKGKRKKE